MSAELLAVDVFPGLTYPVGDGGNLEALAHRAAARGIPLEARTVFPGEALPTAAIYLLGGAEDEDQPELARRLRDGALARAVDGGAAVLAVDAAFQVVGERFTGVDGVEHAGVGLLDARSVLGPLVEGPVVTRPNAVLGLPALSAYETHRGRTTLGPGASAFADLEIGTGNGAGTDGAVAGRVIGTYLHGPLLARNPELADLLLSWATGEALEPCELGFAEEVRRRRITEARRLAGERASRWARWTRRLR
jgi:CobQ-like glutamine amidotransferase family enzyme